MIHDICIEVMARWAAASGPEVLWEDFPEIGEYDWLAIQDRADKIRDAIRPSWDEVRAAQAALATRADRRDR